MRTSVPTLQGKRVLLEPLELHHAKGLADAVPPDDDVWRWMTAAPRTAGEMEAWIRARRTPRAPDLVNFPFLQRDAATGALAGSTSLFDVSAALSQGEIGHTWLAAPYRRTGINTDAKLCLLRFAFEDLGLGRVQLVTDARNVRSQQAIERLGATREGVLRNHRRDIEGKLRDSVYYSVVDREWPVVRARLEGLLR